METLLQFLFSIHPLSKELISYLERTLKHTQLSRRDYLLKIGQVCQNIYFIETGLLRCFYVKHGLEISSWFMKEGDVIVSVQSFFPQKPSYESIQALEDCSLYYISYDELEHIYHTFPEFNFVGRVLTQKYYLLYDQRLYSIVMERAYERYQYLKEHQPELLERVPGRYIASYLGITEATFSRIRSGKKN